MPPSPSCAAHDPKYLCNLYENALLGQNLSPFSLVSNEPLLSASHDYPLRKLKSRVLHPGAAKGGDRARMTGNDDGGADADGSNGGNNNDDGRGDDGNDGTVDHD